MAFPQVAAIGLGGSATDVSSQPITMPSGITGAADELLLAFVTIDGQPTVTGWPAGWTDILGGGNENLSGLAKAYVRYKDSDGSEVDFNLATTTSESSASVVLRITGWHGTSAPELTITANSLTNPNPAALNPAGWNIEDTLWLAYILWDDGRTNATTQPTNYVNFNVRRPNTAASGVGVAVATRENAAASEDPGAWTMSAADPGYFGTIAVRPSLAQTITGASALSGAGTLAPTGVHAWQGASAPSGSGALAADGEVIPGEASGWGPPQNLIATAFSPSRIDLSWDAVTGASGYDVERDGVVVALDVVPTSYSDIGLASSTEYTYRVRAVGN